MRKVSRSATRFLAGLPGEVHYRGVDYPCQAHDLSRKGVLVNGGIPWPAEPELELTIRSASRDLALRLIGRVCRVEEDTENQETQIALEFRELDAAQRDTLERLVARVIEGVAPAALEGLSPTASPQEIRDALEKVPLAHRVALAVRGMPRDREILLRDPSPQVLEALARNPNLGIAELRGLLRLPNLMSSTLEILGRDARWTGNEEIKILIATHARTTFALAERLVSTLNPAAVTRLMQRPGLNPELRMKLGRKFARGRSD